MRRPPTPWAGVGHSYSLLLLVGVAQHFLCSNQDLGSEDVRETIEHGVHLYSQHRKVRTEGFIPGACWLASLVQSANSR